MNRKTKAEERAESALRPVIDYCKSTHGAAAKIARAYAARIGRGERSARNQIDQWLVTEDRRRWIHPSLGAGLLLLDAFNAVRRKR